MTSGRLASLRLPLIAISASPRARARRHRATPTPSSPGSACRPHSERRCRSNAWRPIPAGPAPATQPVHPGSRARARRLPARPAPRRLRGPAEAGRAVARRESAGREARYFASSPVGRAESASRSPGPATALAHLAVGRGQLHDQPALEPGPQPSSTPSSSASGTDDVKIIWRPDSTSTLKSRNSSSWVRSFSATRCTSSIRKAADAAVARAPAADRVTVDRLDQLAGELRGAEAGDRLLAAFLRARCPCACSRWVFPDPLGPTMTSGL